MKPASLAASISLLCAAASSGQTPPKQPMRDAATHEQLVQKLRGATSPLRDYKPVEGTDPSKILPQDIIGRSDILCFEGLATLVPKEAIIFIPPRYQERLGMKEGARMVTWADFYAANHGWISTQEITLDQAAGKVPLDEKVAERVTKSSTLVVATCLGGPVSKLPPKLPPAGTEPQKSIR